MDNMITVEKLKIYKKYDGDIDMWARQTGKQNEMSDADWRLIDSILQNMSLVNNGQVLDDFSAKFDEQLKENIDSQSTIDFLMSFQSNIPKSRFRFKLFSIFPKR